jgi:hypothetical protein
MSPHRKEDESIIKKQGRILFFSSICFKIPFVSPEEWGKINGIFIKVQFWDTPSINGF